MRGADFSVVDRHFLFNYRQRATPPSSDAVSLSFATTSELNDDGLMPCFRLHMPRFVSPPGQFQYDERRQAQGDTIALGDFFAGCVIFLLFIDLMSFAALSVIMIFVDI